MPVRYAASAVERPPSDPVTPLKTASPRALAVTLFAWLAMLGAVLGNAGAFLSPSASPLAASALQWQRYAGTSNAPRASRRDSPRAITQQQHAVKPADWNAGDSGAAAPDAHAWLLLDTGPAPTPALAPGEPPPAPRRRAHLGRAPPASA